MAQSDPNPHEERARQTLARAVAEKMDATGFPVQAVVSQGKPNASELHTLLTENTGLTENTSAPTTPPTATRSRHLTDREVSAMTATEKLVEAYNRAEISDSVRARFEAALSSEALAAAILTFAAVFVASQFTPVGWAEDIALGLTVVFAGTAVIKAGMNLYRFAGAATATTDEQLTAAGHAFAEACAELEVDALLFLIAKAAGGTGGGPPANAPASAGMVLATRNGQLVMVAVDSIPVRVATEWGITGGAAISAAMTAGGDGSGDGGGEPRGGGRKLPAPPRGRVFRRGFLNFMFEGTEEAWDRPRGSSSSRRGSTRRRRSPSSTTSSRPIRTCSTSS